MRRIISPQTFNQQQHKPLLPFSLSSWGLIKQLIKTSPQGVAWKSTTIPAPFIVTIYLDLYRDMDIDIDSWEGERRVLKIYLRRKTHQRYCKIPFYISRNKYTREQIVRVLNQRGRNVIQIESQILVHLTMTLVSVDLIVCQVS